MDSVILSVILPTIGDEKKLIRFCSSLFASSLSVELCICGKPSEETIISLAENFSDKIIVFPENSADKALKKARGAYVMFSDTSVIFSEDAFETMLVRGRGSACVCNAAEVSCGTSAKLLRDNFSLYDTACVNSYFSFLLNNRVITENKLSLCGSDAFSIMLFIADYIRSDIPVVIDEVLMYRDGHFKNDISADLSLIEEYANVFKITNNHQASLFFLNLIFSNFIENKDEKSFLVMRAAALPFKEDFIIIAWLEASFGIDAKALVSDNAEYESFKYGGANVYYKEIALPLNKNDVVMYFYSGKFGVDVLKKCIGAWLYYKLYRGKNGAIKRLGCKLCRKLLGGEFDA